MQRNVEAEVAAAERTLRLSWLIVAGAVIFSVLTVTPLVQRVTPDRWDWTAPILPVVVDAAVVIVVRVDAIVARLDGRPGGWPALLRWLTGLMTLALNIGNSALNADLVGVGVHAVAPILLIVTAEASLKWRHAITTAVARIDRERAEAAVLEARERREQMEREQQAHDDRERRERLDREQQQAAADRREREAREFAAAEQHAVREHEAAVIRERLDREAEAEQRRLDHEDLLRREQREAEAEQRDRHRAEVLNRMMTTPAQPARERPAAPALAAVSTPQLPAVSTPAPAPRPVSTAAHDAPESNYKMPEEGARQAVAVAIREGRSQRQVAALTGWSTGWVAARFQEARAEVSA